MPRRVDPKDPNSSEYFNWDCGSVMLPGDTVASVTSIFVQSGDADALTFDSAPALDADSKIVSRKLGGGAPGSWYVVTCRFVTAAGETLDLELEFYVKAA